MILVSYDIVGGGDITQCISNNFMAFYNTRHILVVDISSQITRYQLLSDEQDKEQLNELKTKLITVMGCENMDELKKISGYKIINGFLHGTEFD